MDFSRFYEKYSSRNIFDNLNTDLEKRVYSFVEDFTKKVRDSEEINYSFKPLGIYVASDLERNFLFANLTAKAIVKNKNSGRGTNFIDLGSGSGINCLVAKMFGAEKVTGIEGDIQTYTFAKKMIKDYNLDYNLIQDNFLERDFKSEKFDIVLNENLYRFLTEEPQLQVAKKIKQNTKPETIFIPSKIQFFLEHKGESHAFDEINFNGDYPDFLTRKVEITSDHREIFVKFKAKIFDEDEKDILGEGEDLRCLPLGSLGNISLNYPDIPRTVTMCWNTLRTQSIQEIFEGANVTI
jgi:SAM-dependent methyltransferase